MMKGTVRWIVTFVTVMTLAAGAVWAEDATLMTLEEAFTLAEEQSPQVRIARLELEGARLAYEKIHSASRMQPDPVALLQAESDYEIARRNLALVTHERRLEVAESFLGVLRIQNLIDVIEGSLHLAKRQVTIAENRFSVGSAAKVEIIRATNQASTARARLLEMEGKRELALMALRMELGLALDEPIALVEPDLHYLQPTALENNFDDDLRFALEHRIEILRARTGVDLARKQVELASNDYTPAIALKQAKVGLDRAEEGLKQVRNGIELEVRQLYQALIDHERQLDVLKQVVGEAEETLAITEEMYEAGVATDIEVLGAQTTLNEARTNYVDTLFDLRTAQVRYVHATARVWSPEGGQ